MENAPVLPSQPIQAPVRHDAPVCVHCDADLSCGACGVEQPYTDISVLKARVEELEGRHREACKEIDELKYLARFIHQQTIVPNNNGEITAWAALLYARLTVIHNATVRS